MMASKYRYVDDIINAKGIMDSGILGEVILLENDFCSTVDMRDRWNSNSEIAGGGVLVDNGSHSVDIMRYLLGPIVKVQAEEGKRVQHLGVEDTARLCLRTESGATGVVNVSWSFNKGHDSYIDLYGTGGALSIGWKFSKYRQSEKHDWIHFGRGYNKMSAFEKQLRNFIGTIKGTEKPLITATDALASVKVIETAYESMKMNKWVEIETGNVSESSVNRMGKPTPTIELFTGIHDKARIHQTALIEESVSIGAGTSVWDSVHIRRDTTIGKDCIIGEKTYIAYDVRIGNGVKINTFVYICTKVTIEDQVMIGAGTIFTNEFFPRAFDADGVSIKTSKPTDKTLETTVRRGVTIGAGCIIGPGIELGEYSMVGMGSVVTKDIQPHQLVSGNPARPNGFVCVCGQRLQEDQSQLPAHAQTLTCPECRRNYISSGRGRLELL